MNIPAIKSLCMKTKTVKILDNPDTREQWIGDGHAAWLVDQGIYVGEDNILALFDIDEKSKKKPYVYRENVRNADMFTSGIYEGEELLEDIGAIWYTGELYRALYGNDGMIFIPVKALKPVRREEYCEFYARRKGDTYYVAVYGSMFCSALIVPITGVEAESIKHEAVAIAAREVFEHKQEPEAEEEEDAEQIGMEELEAEG